MTGPEGKVADATMPIGLTGALESETAATFPHAHRADLAHRVSEARGQHRYLLDHVVREMVSRSQAKDLAVARKTPYFDFALSAAAAP